MKLLVPLTLLALAGCASNGYEKYYTPQPKADEIVASPLIDKAPKNANPTIITIDQDATKLFADLHRHGYIFIGASSFYGPANKTHNAQAIEQAKRVGATLVTIGISHRDTLSGNASFSLPGAPVTSTVNTTGNINGSFYNASSTITTPGAPTYYNIPYHVDRNNFWAGYWVHRDVKTFKFGVLGVDLPPEMVAKLHRNTGVLAQTVVVGTPAFKANILDGDVITKINGVDVVDNATMLTQITQLSGQDVTVDLIRADQNVSIKLTLL